VWPLFKSASSGWFLVPLGIWIAVSACNISKQNNLYEKDKIMAFNEKEEDVDGGGGGSSSPEAPSDSGSSDSEPDVTTADFSDEEGETIDHNEEPPLSDSLGPLQIQVM
jgi:hypothetical protein